MSGAVVGLFKGRMQVPFGYSCYGKTRNNGKTWHYGIDIVGVDSVEVLMPTYKGKIITGTVVSSRIVPEGSADRTWEWGNYVCVQLDANQTPDPVNFMYFAHNKKNLVKVGQKVKSGDVLAIMGNTGNAKYANPPIKHVHFECRATRTGAGINPIDYTGCSNVVGVYGSTLIKPLSGEPAELKISAASPLSAGDVTIMDNLCKSLGIAMRMENGAMITSKASAGDQITIQMKAMSLKLDCTLYVANSASKVQILVDSLRVRTGPSTDGFVQVNSVKKGDVLKTLQVKDGWAYVLTPEEDGWVCLGEDGQIYAKEV